MFIDFKSETPVFSCSLSLTELSFPIMKVVSLTVAEIFAAPSRKKYFRMTSAILRDFWLSSWTEFVKTGIVLKPRSSRSLIRVDSISQFCESHAARDMITPTYFPVSVPLSLPVSLSPSLPAVFILQSARYSSYQSRYSGRESKITFSACGWTIP